MIITAGIYKGRKLLTPDESITRPTLSKVRMGVFNSLYSILGDFSGKSFLDVFGGSGVMGLEALSRGFSDVLTFEINRKSAEVIKQNYKLLGVKLNLKIGDSEQMVCHLEKEYDIAYVDPPYLSDVYNRILKNINSKFIVVEGLKEFTSDNIELIKIKKYGDKYISYLKKIT